MSYRDYNNYQSDSRRNSNSFNEEQLGAKRKRWSNKKRGGSNGPTKNITIDTPLFKEPAPPTRSPMNQGRYNRGGQRDFRGGVNPTTQPYFDMRDMPEFVEPQHSGPAWNWETYFHHCKNWQDKHKLAYYRSRCMSLEFENQMLFDQINSLIEENCVFAAERGVMPAMRLPEIPGRQGQQSERASNTQTTPKKQGKNRKTSSTSGTEIECVVTEDMMAILEQSIRHKLSLKKKKSEDSKEKNEEDSQMKDDSVKTGPKLPMGHKRKEELDQLYGKNSSMIQGLETSVQLNFNRNCDTYKPEVWMSVPLNPKTVTG